jgi:acetolactate synthase I/II/III large subunit
MENYTTVKELINVMNEYGVEYVFYNPGIDNVPLLETLAAYQAQGIKAPKSILCLDEFVAMTAAHGAWMASGHPQVVSVHSELGVLQIGGALHNAQWGRVPVVFFTENQGPPQRTNWKGEPFDQGAMVRSFVKWAHDLASNENAAAAAADILREAFHKATTEPCGPAYVVMPREVFWNKQAITPSRKPAIKREPPTPADEKALSRAADILIAAENPLIITGYAGRNKAALPVLVELAETLAARVLTSDFWVSFPNTHPMAAYLSSAVGFGNPLLTKADAVLAIDYDMHYASPPVTPDKDAKIIHIDIDIVKKGVPLWGRQPDIQIQADSARAIPALTAIIKKKLSPERSKQLQTRFTKFSAEHDRLAGEWRSLAESHARRTPITANWLSKCIDDILDENTIIVNQCISPSAIVAHTIRHSQTGTLYSCQGGCIGWAPGAALGVKLAAPEKTVIGLMGDGAFIYGCPEASLWSAHLYKAPFLAIIYDNRGYGAIKGLFHDKYDVAEMGADIPAPPDYAALAKANHAYGRMVENPDDLPKALQECLAAVRKGQAAVLDVKIEPV